MNTVEYCTTNGTTLHTVMDMPSFGTLVVPATGDEVRLGLDVITKYRVTRVVHYPTAFRVYVYLEEMP